MPDYHQGVKFSVRTTSKVIEDFSFLPGANSRERFEQVVALGLKVAESEVAPALPAPAVLTSYIMTLNDFTVDEIIAHVKIWKRAPTGKLVAALTQHIAEEEWSF